MAHGEDIRPQRDTQNEQLYTRKSLERDLIALHPDLKKLALSLVQNKHDADDLVQETITHALKAADNEQFDGRNIRGWARTILKNHFFSNLRSYDTRNVVRGEEADDIISLRAESQSGSVSLGPEATLEAKERSAQVSRAIENLPPQQKIALESVVEGKPYEEIGKEMGIGEGTVRTHVSRARQNLRKIVNIDDPSGPGSK